MSKQTIFSPINYEPFKKIVYKEENNIYHQFANSSAFVLYCKTGNLDHGKAQTHANNEWKNFKQSLSFLNKVDFLARAQAQVTVNLSLHPTYNINSSSSSLLLIPNTSSTLPNAFINDSTTTNDKPTSLPFQSREQPAINKANAAIKRKAEEIEVLKADIAGLESVKRVRGIEESIVEHKTRLAVLEKESKVLAKKVNYRKKHNAYQKAWRAKKKRLTATSCGGFNFVMRNSDSDSDGDGSSNGEQCSGEQHSPIGIVDSMFLDSPPH